jgi:hypothetical protein
VSATPGVTRVAEMVIAVAFVPVVPIVAVDVAVASVIDAALAVGAATTASPVAKSKVAVVIEINFFNMREPLDVTNGRKLN